jgi:predicted AlkP superfamily pyrophosphatase or phosphodiesterase
MPAPEMVLPDFGGQCITNLVRPLLGRFGDEQGAPEWIPSAVLEARQVVLLVVDGLGYEQLDARRGLAPTIAGATHGVLTTVAPSTTVTALTSLVTGLAPAGHGVLGYRMHVAGGVFNVLTWRLDDVDARQGVPVGRFQPHPSFPGAPTGTPPVVSRAEYATTGFTVAHLGDAPLHGWVTPSGLCVEVGRLLQQGAPFVYAYYDGLDRVSHALGLGEHYDAELRTVDRLVGDLATLLPAGAALVVTADHGQVDVGRTVEVLGPDVMDGVALLSGEGRFRWLHARPGAGDDVEEACREAYGERAWVASRVQVIEEGWLGGEPTPAVMDRLGDVCLVPFEAMAFMDPADTGEQRMVGRHGSLTSAEMLVPLVSIRGGL